MDQTTLVHHGPNVFSLCLMPGTLQRVEWDKAQKLNTTILDVLGFSAFLTFSWGSHWILVMYWSQVWNERQNRRSPRFLRLRQKLGPTTGRDASLGLKLSRPAWVVSHYFPFDVCETENFDSSCVVFKRFGTHDEYLDGLCVDHASVCTTSIDMCSFPRSRFAQDLPSHLLPWRATCRSHSEVVPFRVAMHNMFSTTRCSDDQCGRSALHCGPLYGHIAPAVTCSFTCELSDWDDEVFWPLVDEFRSRATVGLPLTWSVTPSRSRRRSIDRRVFPWPFSPPPQKIAECFADETLKSHFSYAIKKKVEIEHVAKTSRRSSLRRRDREVRGPRWPRWLLARRSFAIVSTGSWARHGAEGVTWSRPVAQGSRERAGVASHSIGSGPGHAGQLGRRHAQQVCGSGHMLTIQHEAETSWKTNVWIVERRGLGQRCKKHPEKVLPAEHTTTTSELNSCLQTCGQEGRSRCSPKTLQWHMYSWDSVFYTRLVDVEAALWTLMELSSHTSLSCGQVVSLRGVQYPGSL